MRTVQAIALLLPSMALSGLALTAGSGCDCSDGSNAGHGWCAPASSCCPEDKPHRYACNVEVEGPTKSDFHAYATEVCGADPNDAEIQAHDQVQSDHPEGVARFAGCAATTCSSAGGT